MQDINENLLNILVIAEGNLTQEVFSELSFSILHESTILIPSNEINH